MPTSSEIVTQDFYGKAVEMHERNGALWFTSEQAATVLGATDRRAVAKLFRLHKSELTEGTEYAYANLAVVTSGEQSSPQVRRVLCLSMQGVEFFALLVRGEEGKRARRWVLDLRASLRAKEKVIADPVKLMAKLRDLEAQLVEAHARHRDDLKATVTQLLESNAVMASALGSALASRRHQIARERALRAELDIGQKLFPYGQDGTAQDSDDEGPKAVNRINGN